MISDPTKSINSKKKYKILEKISEGQFGTVFKAINNDTSNIVKVFIKNIKFRRIGCN